MTSGTGTQRDHPPRDHTDAHIGGDTLPGEAQRGDGHAGVHGRTLPPHLTRCVLDSLPCGVIVVDNDLTVLYGNATAAACCGVAPDAICKSPVTELFAGARFVAPFDGWDAEIERVLATGATIRAECVPPAPSDDRDGTRDTAGLITLSCGPLRNNGAADTADRAPTAVVIVMDDGTARPDNEHRAAVNERLASMSKLVSRVAHELNNPLDGILRYVNLAIRATGQQQQPKLRNYLDESRIGLLRMVDIIGELLQFSRATHGAFDTAGINDIVEQAVRAMAQRADAHGITLAVDFQTCRMPSVRTGRLYQVVCNLITNAIDAMPDGGRLTITTGIQISGIGKFRRVSLKDF
ncbi:MAG: histidine kinase dimerization/phospho-acceptor domain-containing protein [Phycisphaerae bacterium]